MSSRSDVRLRRPRLGAEPPDRPAGRSRRRLGVIVAVLALIIAAVAAVPLAPAGTPSRSPAPTSPGAAVRPAGFGGSAAWPPVVRVTLAPGAGARPIPRSFLGVSTEYWALPMWERDPTVLVRVLSTLRVTGQGPLMLRIGGDSADEALWEPRARRVPEWVVELTPAWLRQTGAILRRLRARVLLDLNLLTASPAIASEWARAAEAGLPRGAVAGFEIGNEPDLYDRQYWMEVTAGSATILPRRLTAAVYARDFRSYARALSASAPGVPLLGPAVAHPRWSARWIAALLAGPHPGLRAISVHEYPYSACADPGDGAFPTVSKLLGEAATAGVAASLRRAVALAHRAGLPLLLTELNSVSCGGMAGVSDAFATALWAPDALFELVRAGVSSVFVHIRPRTVNAAFSLGAGGLAPRPLLYGLILFTRTLGADPRLVALRVQAGRSVRLKAWAVRIAGRRLHILLINKGPRPVTASVRLPASGPAAVQRLLAASAQAQTGETLGGRWLGRDGLWHGRPVRETVALGRRGYRLTLPEDSAALITVRLAPARYRAARAGGMPGRSRRRPSGPAGAAQVCASAATERSRVTRQVG